MQQSALPSHLHRHPISSASTDRRLHQPLTSLHPRSGPSAAIQPATLVATLSARGTPPTNASQTPPSTSMIRSALNRSQRGEFYTPLRISRPILISQLRINDFFWSSSCYPNGRVRTLAMIAKGSTELAKTLKTCLSRGSKPYVRTRQHPSQMPCRRLSSNLGTSHASSQSHRKCRRVQRRSKHQPIRSRCGERRRSGVRAARYPLPNTVASAP